MKKNGSCRKPENYDDIISRPHHVSACRPQMPAAERAAQFSPFAALTGYGDLIKESARFTDQKPELSEERKADLDLWLQAACRFPGEKPEIIFTFFEPDGEKEGGAVRTVSGQIKRVDAYNNQIILEDGTKIDKDSILDIKSICNIMEKYDILKREKGEH